MLHLILCFVRVVGGAKYVCKQSGKETGSGNNVLLSETGSGLRYGAENHLTRQIKCTAAGM